jgi:hypothetical protein
LENWLIYFFYWIVAQTTESLVLIALVLIVAVSVGKTGLNKKGKTMKIRDFAKSVGFEVCGKLTYMGKWDLSSRWYMDEERNIYLVDTIIGTIRIKPNEKG